MYTLHPTSIMLMGVGVPTRAGSVQNEVVYFYTRHLLVNLGKTGKTENTVKSAKTVSQVEIGEV